MELMRLCTEQHRQALRAPAAWVGNETVVSLCPPGLAFMLDGGMSKCSHPQLGVAMGNAGPRVKAAADEVVGTNDEDGVAQAIDKFVLSAQPVTIEK
eukprot:366399-Chlamydomonas_euryale.AAC.24